MGTTPQIQWDISEVTEGQHKNLTWVLTVREQTDEELNRFLHMLKEQEKVMVIVRDPEDMWTLFIHKLGEKK
jgi:hypothetical protein